MAGISENLRQFIYDNFTSIGQLEVLLLLYGTKEKQWTALAVGDELRSNEAAANNQLDELLSTGLITRQNRLNITSYAFSPTLPPEKQEAVKNLANCYNSYRVSIITMIYEKPVDVLRSFSDAFKIKKDK